MEMGVSSGWLLHSVLSGWHRSHNSTPHSHFKNKIKIKQPGLQQFKAVKYNQKNRTEQKKKKKNSSNDENNSRMEWAHMQRRCQWRNNVWRKKKKMRRCGANCRNVTHTVALAKPVGATRWQGGTYNHPTHHMHINGGVHTYTDTHVSEWGGNVERSLYSMSNVFGLYKRLTIILKF